MATDTGTSLPCLWVFANPLPLPPLPSPGSASRHGAVELAAGPCTQPGSSSRTSPWWWQKVPSIFVLLCNKCHSSTATLKKYGRDKLATFYRSQHKDAHLYLWKLSHCVKEWFFQKSVTFLMLNSATNTVQLFLSELHSKSWVCRNLEII